ncbi:aspartate carbamoyltransferase [Acidilobus sp.]|uniref:aspartate carbamoyltransferase n=1 Tax=Acidilobus sp. TaxID=1872109 RepID=UPI003D01DE0D
MGILPWRSRDVIDPRDFTREDLEILFEEADKMRRQLSSGRVARTLEGKIIATAFFEPSTRTRLSFEAAAKRLGADVIGFSAEEATSVAKGESFVDTIRMLDGYADLIVIRHKYEGAAALAAEVARVPVINGGDGSQHHPTQAMLDLYTVRELFGSVDGLNYLIVGDLKYARTVASLLRALSLFKPASVMLSAPPQLQLRDEVRRDVESRGLRLEYVKLEEGLSRADVIYVTRIQRERFPDPQEYEKVRGSYRITRRLLEAYAKGSAKVLHPLPRVDELAADVDSTSYQAYFLQASLGVPLRMALLNLILGGEAS